MTYDELTLAHQQWLLGHIAGLHTLGVEVTPRVWEREAQRLKTMMAAGDRTRAFASRGALKTISVAVMIWVAGVNK